MAALKQMGERDLKELGIPMVKLLSESIHFCLWLVIETSNLLSFFLAPFYMIIMNLLADECIRIMSTKSHFCHGNFIIK